MAMNGEWLADQDDDFVQAHELYLKAYSIIPAEPAAADEEPPPEVLILLRAAAKAWDRYMERERLNKPLG